MESFLKAPPPNRIAFTGQYFSVMPLTHNSKDYKGQVYKCIYEDVVEDIDCISHSVPFIKTYQGNFPYTSVLGKFIQLSSEVILFFCLLWLLGSLALYL